jgi:mannan polymerase complexes MNN9 subunit
MARPMGAVRLRRASPLTLVIGGAIFIFVLFFLASPSDPNTQQSSSSSSPAYRGRPAAAGAVDKPTINRYNLNKIEITADPQGNREAILILTPMARFYDEYWENLLRLSYPHELVSLAFILPKTKEGNAATTALQRAVQRTQRSGPPSARFASVTILRQDDEPAIESQDEAERHKKENQKARRATMAMARNALLFTTLGPATSWVLWLDADIIETPPTLIQDLASHDRDVIAANCFQRFWNEDKKAMDERPYDFNNWVESDVGLEMAAKMDPDDIILEGYHDMATWRPLMAYMADGTDVHKEVMLDGVGGTALLVKADVHRDGAMFPAFPFYHLIETEGFAKMVKRLGRQPVGLPNYKVYHYNE